MTVIENIEGQIAALAAQRKLPRRVRLGTAAYAEYSAARSGPPYVPGPVSRTPAPPPPPRGPSLASLVPALEDKSLAPDAVVVEE